MVIYHLGDDWHRSNICRSWGSHYWRLRICALQVWWFLPTLCSIIHRSMHLHLQLFFRSTSSNVFSYAVQDENFASSATSLAQVYSLELWHFVPLLLLFKSVIFERNIFDLKIIPSKAHHHSWYHRHQHIMLNVKKPGSRCSSREEWHRERSNKCSWWSQIDQICLKIYLKFYIGLSVKLCPDSSQSSS